MRFSYPLMAAIVAAAHATMLPAETSAQEARRHEAPQLASAAANSPGGRVIIVKMIGYGETFRFEPSRIEAEHGDIVRFIHTGEMLHNVRFVTGKIPAGADLKDYMLGPFLPDHGTEYDMNIDGRFLVGSYTFVCIPHEPWDMRGELIVKP